jgi:hypothetical protein
MVTPNPFISFKRPFEVVFLERQEFVQRLPSFFLRVGQDHFLHERQTIRREEHVFRAAKADAFGAERPGHDRVPRDVRVGAHIDFPIACPPRPSPS